MNEVAIITSLLDDDLYKFLMGAVIFHNFPDVEVQYKFINRGGTKFPVGFAEKLNDQIYFLSQIGLTDDEEVNLKSKPFMRPTYVEWLKGFRMNPNEVVVTQQGGDLSITITGKWYKAIFWEVKLMAIISELYFRMTLIKPADDWFQRIEEKAEALNKYRESDCLWSDFGTRRRFSKNVQDAVVKVMAPYRGFIGTSNVALAMKYKVNPIGTSAHEVMMGMGGLFGVKGANRIWLKYWSDYFNGQVGIALTDTFTTDVFLRDFDGELARLWDGLRQDSGDPYEWANKVLNRYRELGIRTTHKKLVFSDALDVEKYLGLVRMFHNSATIIGGIGTNFTNDVLSEEQKAAGIKPLNMVIKLAQIRRVGGKWQNVVKLSDDKGKHTGVAETIAHVKNELGITT